MKEDPCKDEIGGILYYGKFTVVCRFRVLGYQSMKGAKLWDIGTPANDSL